MLSTVIVEKKLAETLKNKAEEKAPIKPLSLSHMQKKIRDFEAQCKQIEMEWEEHLRSVASAKTCFFEKNHTYHFQQSEMAHETIIEEYNQALAKWHDRIDMIRESIYADEAEAKKLFNTQGCDKDAELARELSVKMRKIIEPRREILRKCQREVDQHSIILLETPSSEAWTSWLWKLIAKNPQTDAQDPTVKTLPTMKGL